MCMMVLCLVSATQKYPLYWFHVLPAGVLAGNGNGEQGSIKAEILTGTALFVLYSFPIKIYWGKKKQWNRAMPLNQFCQPVKHFLFQLFSTTSPFKLILSHTMKHCRGVLVFLFMLLNLCLSGVFYLFVCLFGLVCEDTATYVCLRLCI